MVAMLVGIYLVTKWVTKGKDIEDVEEKEQKEQQTQDAGSKEEESVNEWEKPDNWDDSKIQVDFYSELKPLPDLYQTLASHVFSKTESFFDMMNVIGDYAISDEGTHLLGVSVFSEVDLPQYSAELITTKDKKLVQDSITGELDWSQKKPWRMGVNIKMKNKSEQKPREHHVLMYDKSRGLGRKPEWKARSARLLTPVEVWNGYVHWKTTKNKQAAPPPGTTDHTSKTDKFKFFEKYIVSR